MATQRERFKTEPGPQVAVPMVRVSRPVPAGEVVTAVAPEPEAAPVEAMPAAEAQAEDAQPNEAGE